MKDEMSLVEKKLVETITLNTVGYLVEDNIYQKWEEFKEKNLVI